MKNKKFKLISEISEYEYDIKLIKANSKTTIKLFYSNNDIWNPKIRREKVLTLIDDGNSIVFKPKIKKILDYEQDNHIRILLSFNEKISNIQIPIKSYTAITDDKTSIFTI